MALLTTGSQLALVDVRVTILAPLSNIGEDRLDMTFSAGHGRVHPAQWILGLVVIEFRDGADRFPGVRGVAVLAGYVQASMRAARAS
jgi:hypothetical protein